MTNAGVTGFWLYVDSKREFKDPFETKDAAMEAAQEYLDTATGVRIIAVSGRALGYYYDKKIAQWIRYKPRYSEQLLEPDPDSQLD